jgi:VIT1/CCC1 family predicted Fe2+/Mn2+ transporter
MLPFAFLVVCAIVTFFRRKEDAKPSAAIFMRLGLWFLGTLAMAIGATIRGAGFLREPLSTTLSVVLGSVIPIYAFIAATYDGSLYALILVTVLALLLHALFEPNHWIIPPRKVS